MGRGLNSRSKAIAGCNAISQPGKRSNFSCRGKLITVSGAINDSTAYAPNECQNKRYIRWCGLSVKWSFVCPTTECFAGGRFGQAAGDVSFTTIGGVPSKLRLGGVGP